MLRIGFLILLAFALNGCASLSKEECLAGNWNDIGHRDGRQGYKTASLDAHFKSCAEHGVRHDRDRYMQGYKQGLNVYCTPTNGRRVGEAGRTYHYVCPANKEEAFLRQHRYGRELYDAEKKISSARSDLDSKEEKLRVEKNSSIRTTLRSEIAALDDLIRTLKRNYNHLRDNPPR